MQKLLARCETGMLYVGCFSTFVMMLLTTADTVVRYLFSSPIIGAYELTTNYLMVSAIFLSVAYGYRGGAYIRVTFLTDRLRGKVKTAIYFFVQIVSTVYGFMLVIATIQQVKRIYSDHTALSSIDIPLWPAYVIVPVGLFFMSLLMLLDLRKVKAGKSSLFQDDAPES
ncbi:MAG: TRAP transporter small permease [Deltaproteobacteria bacterium]|nr:TRAP transporter small permease [Deltaproteobacteria bacterium]